MSTLPTRTLLLAGLLLLGWGFASWLEERAPWNSLSGGAARTSGDHAEVDIRVLIEEEARLQGQPAVIAGSTHVAPPPPLTREESAISLASGTSHSSASESKPVWLTGQIEF